MNILDQLEHLRRAVIDGHQPHELPAGRLVHHWLITHPRSDDQYHTVEQSYLGSVKASIAICTPPMPGDSL